MTRIDTLLRIIIIAMALCIGLLLGATMHKIAKMPPLQPVKMQPYSWVV